MRLRTACYGFLTTALLVCSVTSHAQALPPVQTIASLDVPRYMGTWFELAKFPNVFQRKCVSNTRAVYTLNADNTVQVLNRCRIQDGSAIEALGQAKQMGNATSPVLKVRFAPEWLGWLPLVWGDYWVIDLDDQYQLAAVSDAKREYLWVLSRSPKIDQTRYAALLQRLKQQGFDVDKLQVT
ncbi:MAG: lipocalin, partial [Betaproteobacteria bacterium]|nr:lipocalin [Betaproteobacteria bacterium]